MNAARCFQRFLPLAVPPIGEQGNAHRDLLARQTLTLYAADGQLVRSYLVSPVKRGRGGARQAVNPARSAHHPSLHRTRAPPIRFLSHGGRVAKSTPRYAADNPQRDWILSRTFWLSGCEIDSTAWVTLYAPLYLHPWHPRQRADGQTGFACCVRMCNADILDLFETCKARGLRVGNRRGLIAVLPTKPCSPQKRPPAMKPRSTKVSFHHSRSARRSRHGSHNRTPALSTNTADTLPA